MVDVSAHPVQCRSPSQLITTVGSSGVEGTLGEGAAGGSAVEASVDGARFPGSSRKLGLFGGISPPMTSGRGCSLVPMVPGKLLLK